MGMPQLVVTAVLVEGRSKSEVARDYGVSRRWVITLVQHYLAAGAPACSPARVGRGGARPGPPTSSRTRSSRSARISTGTDTKAGAATIAAHLQRRHGASSAVSTIWRILTA